MRMKCLLILMLIITSTGSHAQEIGYLSIGSSHILKDIELHHQAVEKLGFSLDFIFPVIKPNIYYRAKASYHKAIVDPRCKCIQKKHYVSALNEIMIGKKYRLSDNVYAFPMFGTGVYARAVYSPGDGIANAFFVFSWKNHIMYTLKKFDIGFYIDIDYLITDGYLDFSNEFMIHAGISIGK